MKALISLISVFVFCFIPGISFGQEGDDSWEQRMKAMEKQWDELEEKVDKQWDDRQEAMDKQWKVPASGADKQSIPEPVPKRLEPPEPEVKEPTEKLKPVEAEPQAPEPETIPEKKAEPVEDEPPTPKADPTPEEIVPRKQEHIIGEGILETIPKVGLDPNTPVTGVIIAASGFDIQPALMYTAVGSSGGTSYAPDKIDPEILSRKGACGWAGTKGQAMQNPRVGINPIIINATRVKTDSGLHIWIDDSNLDETEKTEIEDLFNKCAVVITF